MKRQKIVREGFFETLLISAALGETKIHMEDIMRKNGDHNDLNDNEAALIASLFLTVKNGQPLKPKALCALSGIPYEKYWTMQKSAMRKISRRVNSIKKSAQQSH